MDLAGLDTVLGLIEILRDEKKYGPVLDEMRALRDERKASEERIAVLADTAHENNNKKNKR